MHKGLNTVKISITATFVHSCFFFFSWECVLFARVFTCRRVCAVVFQWIDIICVADGCFVKPWAVITGIIAAAVFSLIFYQSHWNAWYEMFQRSESDLSTSIVLCGPSCDGEIRFVCSVPTFLPLIRCSRLSVVCCCARWNSLSLQINIERKSAARALGFEASRVEIWETRQFKLSLSNWVKSWRKYQCNPISTCQAYLSQWR